MINHKLSIHISNSFTRDLVVLLEPWGYQYSVPQGKTYKVEAEGPEGDTFHLEFGDGNVTVFGWDGSVVTISEVQEDHM